MKTTPRARRRRRDRVAEGVARVFEQAQPLDPKEFAFLVQVAQAAGTMRTPVTNPEQFGFNLVSEDGETTGIRFTDHPVNRAMLAVKEHYGEDRDRAVAAMMRLMAFWVIYRTVECDRWKKKDPEDVGFTLLHDSVMDVAATMPLNGDGHFDVPRFFAKVAEVAERDYPEDFR
jgi:hypothetical protein